MRGYRGNSLGPRDRYERTGREEPIGGNLRVVGSTELIFPVPFSEIESLRMLAFVDAGNVFDTREDVDWGELRYSAGVGLTWLSPLGALTFSFARPLNDRAEDRTQVFQFSLGSLF